MTLLLGSGRTLCRRKRWHRGSRSLDEEEAERTRCSRMACSLPPYTHIHFLSSNLHCLHACMYFCWILLPRTYTHRFPALNIIAWLRFLLSNHLSFVLLSEVSLSFSSLICCNDLVHISVSLLCGSSAAASHTANLVRRSTPAEKIPGNFHLLHQRLSTVVPGVRPLAAAHRHVVGRSCTLSRLHLSRKSNRNETDKRGISSGMCCSVTLSVVSP